MHTSMLYHEKKWYRKKDKLYGYTAYDKGNAIRFRKPSILGIWNSWWFYLGYLFPGSTDRQMLWGEWSNDPADVSWIRCSSCGWLIRCVLYRITLHFWSGYILRRFPTFTLQTVSIGFQMEPTKTLRGFQGSVQPDFKANDLHGGCFDHWHEVAFVFHVTDKWKDRCFLVGLFELGPDEICEDGGVKLPEDVYNIISIIETDMLY